MHLPSVGRIAAFTAAILILRLEGVLNGLGEVIVLWAKVLAHIVGGAAASGATTTTTLPALAPLISHLLG